MVSVKIYIHCMYEMREEGSEEPFVSEVFGYNVKPHQLILSSRHWMVVRKKDGGMDIF